MSHNSCAAPANMEAPSGHDAKFRLQYLIVACRVAQGACKDGRTGGGG